MATQEENKNLFKLAWKLGGSSFINYAIGWMERDSHKDMGSAARSYLDVTSTTRSIKPKQNTKPNESIETQYEQPTKNT
jgi:hypothetical protein